MGRFIGVDLHKTTFTVCFLKGKKKQLAKYKMSQIKQFCQQLKTDDQVALETTTNTRHFVSLIEKLVKEVYVIDDFQFKVISASVKKTDATDAETMALFSSKGILPVVRMKDDKYAELESLANTRDKLVKLKSALKNKIHNILCAKGIAIRYSAYLRVFYEKLKAKKGSGKAIIATAKKLLGIIYLTLKNNWVFEDFPNFVLRKV